MKQRVTFTATLEIDNDGMNWKDAEGEVIQALLDGDGGEATYLLSLVKVTRMENAEGEE